MSDGEVGRAFARGVVADMAMSGMRRMTTGLGLVEEEPPEQIAGEGVPGLARVPPDLRAEAIELAHWTYGGVGGVAFGAFPAAVRRKSWAGPPAYGLATWLFFETALAPLLGLRRTRESRHLERAAIAADHVLYGHVVAGRTA